MAGRQDLLGCNVIEALALPRNGMAKPSASFGANNASAYRIFLCETDIATMYDVAFKSRGEVRFGG